MPIFSKIVNDLKKIDDISRKLDDVIEISKETGTLHFMYRRDCVLARIYQQGTVAGACTAASKDGLWEISG